ncbi:MAG: hypothetical protein Q7U48_13730 [Hydrogenophaga sp.]|nr:hypothetical protein [Hydrogenophaga sp.]
MDSSAFAKAYNKIRNGTDGFHFSPLLRRFLYSDGVKECADAGCHWLLDILGSELPKVFRYRLPHQSALIIEVAVSDKSVAVITGKFSDDLPPQYRRKVDWTDLPAGTWQFYVSDDGDGCLRCILLTEY